MFHADCHGRLRVQSMSTLLHEVVSSILLTESEEKDPQMKDQDANIPLTRFEQSFDGHVPVG